MQTQGELRGRIASGTPEFKTHIPPLDRLLGYDPISDRGAGICQGDIILLRGGPGSGKTTLGLQIMSSYLASDDCLYAGDRFVAVFVSLETDPVQAIDKVIADFHFFQRRRHHLLALPASAMTELVRQPPNRKENARADALVEGFVKFGTGLIVGPAKDIIVPLARSFTRWMSSLTPPEGGPEETGTTTEGERVSPEGILFIDSVNALLSIVQQHEQVDPSASRLTLNRAFRMIRKQFSRFVILATSEFHRDPTWVASGMAESFLSDVEIVLTSEPIVVPAGYEGSRQGSVGYNIFKIIDQPRSDKAAKLEARSFLRVVKSRKAANQSRRCAYDIVKGSGLKFYDTYPSDGHILLFSENVKQKRAWDTFFKEDLPELYPALRYENFDRSSLQRIFMNQRRSRYVPSRTDMYVSSFDNYWVNWYGELCWRRAVAEGVEATLCGTHSTAAVAELTGAVHMSLMVDPGALRRRLFRALTEQGELKKCLSGRHRGPVLDGLVTAFASLSRRSTCIQCFFCRLCWHVLSTMADCNGGEFAHAVRVLLGENDQSTNKNTQSPTIAPDVFPTASEIHNVLLKMKQSAAEVGCCESSPIRWLYIKGHEDVDAVQVLMRTLEAAYQKPSDSEEDFRKEAKTLPHGLRDANASTADAVQALMRTLKAAYRKPSYSEEDLRKEAETLPHGLRDAKASTVALLAKTEGFSYWVRSDRAQRRLEREILNQAVGVSQNINESEVLAILCGHLDEDCGCECVLEFWKHLQHVLRGYENQHDRGEGKTWAGIRETLHSLRFEIVDTIFSIVPTVLWDARRPVVRHKWRKGHAKATGESLSVRDLWAQCATIKGQYGVLYDLACAYHLVLRKRNSYHFLTEIPDDKVRLFGERRTQIIEELERADVDEKRPVHRPGLLFSMRDTRSTISVPYNANISFIVYRHDLVRRFVAKHLWNHGKAQVDFGKYVDQVTRLYQNEVSVLREGDSPQVSEQRIGELISDTLSEYSMKGGQSSGPVETWEELIVLLRLMNAKGRPRGRGGPNKQSLHFVIETQTFDTLLCTMLELLWNCGGNLRIRPDYTIDDEEITAGKLLHALYLLTVMLNDGLIPDDATLDPTHFASKYSYTSGSTPSKCDWVFARQWHSTLVELLTAESQSDSPEVSTPRFLWRNPAAELAIMPIPISLSYYLEQKGNIHQSTKPDSARRVCHSSCWGDWHFIVTNGTENTDLAIDLINNLMGSQKICERAFQSAALPTVEEFYTLYGGSRCLDLPERRHEAPRMLPDVTFSGLRTMLFRNARSRSEIFDYEHCMLEFQSLYQLVRILARCKHFDWNIPREGAKEPRIKELRQAIRDAFGRIKGLGIRGMLRV